MYEVSNNIRISATKSQVFATFTDFELLPRILHSAHEVKFLSDHKQGLGTKWEQKTGELEKPITATHEIVALDAPNSFAMTSDDGAAKETMSFTFQEITPETAQVTLTMTVTKGCLAVLLAPMVKAGVKEILKEDLQKMKDHIENSHL